MTRILPAVLALLLAVPASAACTWTATSSYTAQAICADGDEVAPTLVTEGLGLTPLGRGTHAVTVTAAADSGQTITSGTLKAYTWDTKVGAWARAPRLDITVPVAGERRLDLDTLEVIGGTGRLAYAPSVVTLSGGGISIFLTASP